MKSILLHTCCAPCSAPIIEYLLAANIRPAIFFYNPNINTRSEYDRRYSEVVRFAGGQHIEIIEGDYHHEQWLQLVAGHEQNTERGARCLICFKMRLKETARLTSIRGFTMFATSLASSRWKNLQQISIAGQWATSQFSGVEFLDTNWRKGGLSERRAELL
jgi:predicted adenine nucleotide alpha hydrolase (AANH) superfamily ATPase